MRRISFTEVCVILLAVLCAGLVQAATTRKAPVPYATIQEGINAAANGDTVRVQPGTYSAGFTSSMATGWRHG